MHSPGTKIYEGYLGLQKKKKKKKKKIKKTKKNENWPNEMQQLSKDF